MAKTKELEAEQLAIAEAAAKEKAGQYRNKTGNRKNQKQADNQGKNMEIVFKYLEPKKLKYFIKW